MASYKQLSEASYYQEIANSIYQVFRDNEGGVIILGGGNSPKKVNRELICLLDNEPELIEKINSNFHILLSDERYVPLDDDLSNYKMLQETLPFTNIVPFYTNLNLEECLSRAVDTIQALKNSRVLYALLGLGSDGHTASIFPNSPSELWDQEILGLGGIGPEGKQRITLSPKFLASAKNIHIICNSKDKEKALNRAKSESLPISMFTNLENTTFLLLKNLK